MSKKSRAAAAEYGLALLKSTHEIATKSLHRAIEDLSVQLSAERDALAVARGELASAHTEIAALTAKLGDAVTASAAAASKAKLSEEKPAPASTAPEAKAPEAKEEPAAGISAELLEAARLLGWDPGALQKSIAASN